MTDDVAGDAKRGGLAQLVATGLLAGFIGFASSFAIVLHGLETVGASPEQAASGLLALSLAMGLLGVWFSHRTKMPVSIAWSTPGAALLITIAAPEGGFPEAVGAFLAAAAMIVVAGLWRPFGRAIAAIPVALASAMLAGVLLDLCLAPMVAVGEMPAYALPIVISWAVALRYARLYAVPVAVAVTALMIFLATPMPEGALAGAWPRPVLVMPEFSLDTIIGIGLPLFIVTMASQNVPGLAVLNANGYRPKVGPIFVATGAASGVTAAFGGHLVNLAAITAALCAGPEAHPDPRRRYIAAITTGWTYVGFALFAGFAAAFIAAAPPLLIETVAGLALFGSLGGALLSALAKEEDRLPAVLTFVTTASGLSFFGVGAAFWGLVAGGLLMLLGRLGRKG
ncbi:benzoate/H(+) symporter BenE family transporter [Inquilinus sp. CAU 1745]|uniref:benzoate/H(+) symporter BenE family transporter n=1 Tax=Inquilinus sp. CAU 1745 TaxID=3140369 RepID=UPI00325A7F12